MTILKEEDEISIEKIDIENFFDSFIYYRLENIYITSNEILQDHNFINVSNFQD